MYGLTCCLHRTAVLLLSVVVACQSAYSQQDELTEEQWIQIDAIEQQRIRAIESVVGSVVAIYGEDRQGGGSGVVIDPSGIALTNHHVIMGAGVSGWGGLADGQLYHWRLIGTDPGGDVSLIQLEGKESFPFTRLGDSDRVQIGDWALAMGNPFVLTEDQFPTVTLGIVSGIKRYQPGAGANQLVYGNCIQVDSSINPGNSGGPLFNFSGQVIGINGRGSFRDRGRVNVGLGYAISSNQIKNFLPDLLATKLVEHGSLDANFSDRQDKVVCSTINQEAPIAAAGLALGDELIEFEGQAVRSANQFTNLICTLPAEWPAQLKIRKADQSLVEIHTRLLGLPYPKPPAKGKEKPSEPGQDPEQTEQVDAMRKLLAAPAGRIREPDVNRGYAQRLLQQWVKSDRAGSDLASLVVLLVTDKIHRQGEAVGTQRLYLLTDGRFRVEWDQEGTKTIYWYDGKSFFKQTADQVPQQLSLVEAKLELPLVQALGMLAPNLDQPFGPFGEHYIDGSDKALDRVAYRMSQRDADQDSFYYWLTCDEQASHPRYELSKASAEKNLHESGGVLFADWQTVDPPQGAEGLSVRLPKQRAFATGLAETEVLKLVNQEVNWLPQADEGWFSSEEAQ